MSNVKFLKPYGCYLPAFNGALHFFSTGDYTSTTIYDQQTLNYLLAQGIVQAVDPSDTTATVSVYGSTPLPMTLTPTLVTQSFGGYATLDSTGHIPASQLPTAISGSLQYQGTWNATTNIPVLASGTGTKGYFYKVATAGTTTIDGISQWNVGDTIVFDGTTWDKIDGLANEVISVAGRTGAVTLSSADLSDGATLVSSTKGLLGLSYVTNDRTSGGTPGAITLALTDAGKRLYHPGSDTASRVVTIDTNAHVAFADTASIPFFNDLLAGTLVFTPANGVTLILNGASVATATCAAGYGGVLNHLTGDRWEITGGSLS